MRAAALTRFRQAEARRLALTFAVVYFAQGMWDLPTQPLTFMLKERFGYSATQVASFFAVTTLPWLIKPAYGLLSDGVPLFGRRRQSYLIVTSALATTAGLGLTLLPESTPWQMAVLLTAMGFGLAFSDVVVDALMVAHGQRWRLTGAFQAVQWASIETASVLVGVGGGALTERGLLRLAFVLASLASAAAIVGALAYGGLSRRVALNTLLRMSIGIGVASTLAYLLYKGVVSAVLIDVTFGGIGMLGTLAFLDLAAKACPKEAEGTCFALLMSLYNGGVQGSEIVGGWLYDSLGYTRLILLSAACTALCWLLLPLVPVEQIEALAAAPDVAEGPPGSRAGTNRTGS
jgi:MFS family permease